MQPPDAFHGLQYTKNAFAAGAIFGVFGARGTRLVAANVVLPRWIWGGALPGVGKTGGREGRRRKRKERIGMGENTL